MRILTQQTLLETTFANRSENSRQLRIVFGFGDSRQVVQLRGDRLPGKIPAAESEREPAQALGPR